MDDIAEQLGKRILYIRRAKGISQEEVAQVANIRRTYIGQIERGNFNMRLDTLEGICKALRVSPADLFKSVQVQDNGRDKQRLSFLREEEAVCPNCGTFFRP
jgi:transcriptional regulator with XRE-family HTH domain